MTMRSMVRLTSVLTALGVLLLSGSGAAGAAPPPPQPPNFGPNVIVFDPSMPTSQIQADRRRDRTPSRSTTRWARSATPCCSSRARTAPPTHRSSSRSATTPRWPAWARRPTDVTINGHVDVYNRCLTPDNCIALVNFWRSLSNLTINVTGLTGCRASGDFWAVSQAAPMRRVNVTGGNLTLMDYCTAGPQYASGGFIADSRDRLRHQRLAAAVPRPRQQHRRLVERRLEPGVLRRRRARPPQSSSRNPPLHDAGRRAR